MSEREADFLELVIIATSSFASFHNGSTLSFLNNSPSIIISSQNALSSASSSTTPSLEINSAFDRARQAAR